jgi:hypothetical protein
MRRLHSRLALHHSRLLAGSVAGGSGEETNA